ncbi:MAG: DUF4394 domain-containing protein, partial [Saprospiraceae bacterium]|nr:DUF4394 domain-containing protein [Saprospiraceae bacterium]
NATKPRDVLPDLAITGITPTQTLVGLDVRPATGELYALGYVQATGEARLYVVNPTNGVAVGIGNSSVVLPKNMGKVSVDFNPTVDRIRVVGSNNANLRMHPTTGLLVATDGNLAFAATDVNAGKNPSIGAAAYTNSYIGSSSTTLYNYDDSLNVLTSQIPPNDGILNTIGRSGLTVNLAAPNTDMDIYYDPIRRTNRAFLIANTGNNTTLYVINLNTGAASLMSFLRTKTIITDIAVAIDRNIPATITGKLVYALASNNNLLSFDSNLPTIIRTATPVTGIAMGQMLSGLDSRPATGELYALGYNPMTGEGRLYTINPATGAATAIGSTPFMLGMGLGKIGFDFNPTVDRIRVTGSNEANFRLHPTLGTIVAIDKALNFNATDANVGKNPSIGAVAYTNSFIGATATTLYNYDDSLNILATQIPPNDGVLNTVGSSNLMVNLMEPTADFDILFDEITGTNIGLLSANPKGQTFDNLYVISLTNGATRAIGRIGFGISITDIAVAIDRTIPSTITGKLVYGLAANNNLITFDSELPSIIRTATSVTGVASGQMLVGMDVRPATGELFALGYNATTAEGQLYVINPTTAMATPVVISTIPMNLGDGQRVGFDFNPTVDRIRVVAANNINLRLNPITGALAFTDANLAFAMGDPSQGINPAVGTCAYTNSFSNTTTTTLYGLDDSLATLLTQIPPNDGKLNTVGRINLMLNLADPSTDMDIFYDFNTNTNIALLAANTGMSNFDFLYTFRFSNWCCYFDWEIGNGIAVRDITTAIDSFPTVGGRDAIIYQSTELAFAPNPATEAVTFQFEIADAAKVQIVMVDVSGRTVGVVSNQTFAAGDHSINWNRNNLPAGYYFVQFYLNGKLQNTSKLAIQ